MVIFFIALASIHMLKCLVTVHYELLFKTL